MKVYFIGAGPGDPELITVKAVKILERINICIYAGSLVNPDVLQYLPKGARILDSASMSLDDVVAVYKEAKEMDVDVARVHTGDPALYGAINEQMEELEEMGVEYDVVPGVSSFQAAAAALKTELTMPEISQAVVLTRTSGRTPMPEGQELERMAQNKATLCIFLSTHKIEEVSDTLIPYYGKDCPAAVVYKASWPDQLIIQGTLSTIAKRTMATGIKKTALIIVGHALGARGTISKLYDKNFSHEFRKAVK